MKGTEHAHISCNSITFWHLSKICGEDTADILCHVFAFVRWCQLYLYLYHMFAFVRNRHGKPLLPHTHSHTQHTHTQPLPVGDFVLLLCSLFLDVWRTQERFSSRSSQSSSTWLIRICAMTHSMTHSFSCRSIYDRSKKKPSSLSSPSSSSSSSSAAPSTSIPDT